MTVQYSELTSTQRAAVLVLSLGQDIAPLILKELNEAEIELLTLEIANLRDISPNAAEKVLGDASTIIMANKYISQGGVDYARSLLEKALGTRYDADDEW